MGACLLFRGRSLRQAASGCQQGLMRATDTAGRWRESIGWAKGEAKASGGGQPPSLVHFQNTRSARASDRPNSASAATTPADASSDGQGDDTRVPLSGGGRATPG